LLEVVPVGALIEEEAGRVTCGEVEFEQESIFEDSGLQGERWVALEEDGV
jgi:hypothetical protein